MNEISDERYTPVWLPNGSSRPGGCPRCEGTGAVGSDDERAPWSFWWSLRPPSDMAVRVGLVWPVRCPQCAGTGLADGVR